MPSIMWDGRLDNKESLVARLGLDSRQCDDEAVVTAAYVTWGAEAFERLIGDWAVALWHRDARTMILARDFAGARPLYFKRRGDTIEWSSDLRSFFTTEAAPAVDRAYVYRFIADDPAQDQSPYLDVSVVPPGYVLQFTSSGIRRSIGWLPSPEDRVEFRRGADYEEALWDRLREAVRCRLRPGTWAELSGGLDSSSVVCIAARIAQEQALGTPKTLSYVHDAGHPDDERPYMEAVVRATSVVNKQIGERDYTAFGFDETAPFPRPIPNLGRTLHVSRLLKGEGGACLLRGHGGDAVMWSLSTAPHLVDELRRGQLSVCHRTARAIAAATGLTYWQVLHRDLVKSWKRVRLPLPGWLTPDSHTSRQSVRDGEADRHASNAWRVSRRHIAQAMRVSAYHSFRTTADIDVCSPFLDRRVVQFMLAMPFDRKVTAGQTRTLQRASIGRLLPSAVATRTTKVSGDGYVCRALTREWTPLLQLISPRANVVREGYVDYRRTRDALEQVRMGIGTDAFSVLRLIAVERWLKDLQRHPWRHERRH
ncbi:MAG: asparagine synthase-related protein [Acidobacteriota bacterium]